MTQKYEEAYAQSYSLRTICSKSLETTQMPIVGRVIEETTAYSYNDRGTNRIGLGPMELSAPKPRRSQANGGELVALATEDYVARAISLYTSMEWSSECIVTWKTSEVGGKYIEYTTICLNKGWYKTYTPTYVKKKKRVENQP